MEDERDRWCTTCGHQSREHLGYSGCVGAGRDGETCDCKGKTY